MLMMKMLSAALLLVTSTAAAQTDERRFHDGVAVEQVREVVVDLGYRGQIDFVPESRMPFIESAAHGIDFVMYFYGCEDGERCTSIQYTAVWPAKGHEQLDLNIWNSLRRFIVAFRQTEGSVGVRMDTNVDDGVTVDHLRDTFEIWVSFLENFDRFRRTGELN